MADDFRHLRLERDARGVATVTFDVQDSPVNVFNDEVARELQQVVEQTRARSAEGGRVPQREARRVPGRGRRPPDPSSRKRKTRCGPYSPPGKNCSTASSGCRSRPSR